MFTFSIFAAEIHDAAQQGNLQRVQEILAEYPSLLDQPDDRQFTPLNRAVAGGNYDVFMYLLEQGADINTVDVDGSNLLINAASGGNLELIKFLVEEKGFDVNFIDNNEMTAFYTACRSGSVPVIKYFVEKGVDIKPRSARNGTPIVDAIYSDSLEAFEYLLDLGCEYDVANQWGVAPVHYAAYRGQTEMLKMLMDKGVDIFQETMNRETPFIWAVVARRFDTADFLLENGEDVNRLISGGVTPIHSAYKLRPESLDYLIEKGADLTIVDSTGNTVLHAAAWSQDDELVTKLIDFGAEVNVMNDDGETPLLNACWRDSIDVVQVLLENGAHQEIGVCKNGDSCTNALLPPLHNCTKRGNTEFVEMLLRYDGDANQIDSGLNRTPLHFAAAKGNMDLTKLFMENKALVNAEDIFGNTPLYYAKIHNNLDVANFLEQEGGETGKIAKKYQQNLLQEELKDSEAIIWFTEHSGWIFKTTNNLIIVDYWEMTDRPENGCLANGWINPEEIKDYNVTVLVSHEHQDHYDPVIWEWQETIPNIRYIFGMEVADQEGYEVIEPRTSRYYDNLKITAFASNDTGVGFVIEADGVTILHPGDHANRQRDFSGTYWTEIEFVKANFPKIDISMMPISGCGFRDQEAVRLGVVRTLQELQPKVFLPMHATDNGNKYKAFIDNLKEENIKKTKLYYQLDKGDRFIFRKGKLI
jgi:ankyrin repeat protein